MPFIPAAAAVGNVDAASFDRKVSSAAPFRECICQDWILLNAVASGAAVALAIGDSAMANPSLRPHVVASI